MDDLTAVNSVFVNEWSTKAGDVLIDNRRKGFWDDCPEGDLPDAEVAQKLMLIVSEVAEALEAVRDGYPPSEKLSEYGNFEEELADTVIRIMDLGARMGLDIGGAIEAKIDYNAGRPHKHGRAF